MGERETYYTVQAFVKGKGKKLDPEPVVEFATEAEAMRKAERLAGHKEGVLVSSRSGDPSSDDWDDLVPLKAFGQVPDDVAILPF